MFQIVHYWYIKICYFAKFIFLDVVFFLVHSLGFSMYDIMSSANGDSFTPFFSNLNVFPFSHL